MMMPPTTALITVLEPLEETKAAIVRKGFEQMFAKIEGWQIEANDLVVTSEEDTRKMTSARLLRLEIKAARVTLEKRRKEMKASVLLEGKAIDGAFAIFESMASPLETHLLEQETFAVRAQSGRIEEVRKLRAETLTALGVRAEALPPALGTLDADVWSDVLNDAKAAKERRDEDAQRAEALRIETERAVAKQQADLRRVAEESERRAEERRIEQEAANARKQADDKAVIDALMADVHEKGQAAMRMAVELVRLEQERDEVIRKEQEKTAREAESRKPTKRKYEAMLAALHEIANWKEDNRLVLTHENVVARTTLREIGEAPEGK